VLLLLLLLLRGVGRFLSNERDKASKAGRARGSDSAAQQQQQRAAGEEKRRSRGAGRSE